MLVQEILREDRHIYNYDPAVTERAKEVLKSGIGIRGTRRREPMRF